MKHSPTATANALATIGGTFYIACRMLVGLFPNLFFSIAQSWFHGIELTNSNYWNPSMITFVNGLVSLTAFAWITGYFFAVVYNYFNKR